MLYVIKPHITSTSGFASSLTITIVFGRGDWKQAVLIAALAALPAVERRRRTRLLSSPGARGWGGWRGGRGHLVNQYSLCVTQGRSSRGGGETVTRLSLFERFVQTLCLRALRQHDLNPGLRRWHGTAACAIYGLFIGGQRDLNALHHDGGRLSWHTLFPAALKERRRDMRIKVRLKRYQIMTCGLHHSGLISDYATENYWNKSAVGEVPYLFMSNSWN